MCSFMLVCPTTKGEKKHPQQELGNANRAPQRWHVRAMLFNYLEHRNTYREKCTGYKRCTSNFLYDLSWEHFSVM